MWDSNKAKREIVRKRDWGLGVIYDDGEQVDGEGKQARWVAKCEMWAVSYDWGRRIDDSELRSVIVFLLSLWEYVSVWLCCYVLIFDPSLHICSHWVLRPISPVAHQCQSAYTNSNVYRTKKKKIAMCRDEKNQSNRLTHPTYFNTEVKWSRFGELIFCANKNMQHNLSKIVGHTYWPDGPNLYSHL